MHPVSRVAHPPQRTLRKHHTQAARRLAPPPPETSPSSGAVRARQSVAWHELHGPPRPFATPWPKYREPGPRLPLVRVVQAPPR